MKKKVSENEFKDMVKCHGFDWHKYPDAHYCPFCGMLEWKSDKMPDFEIVSHGRKTLVEVKQSSKDGYWNFSNEEAGIRDIQRNELDRYEKKHGIPTWLFVVLGTGRAPKGRSAWLIPWKDYKQIEKELLAKGQRSIARDTKRNIGGLEAYEGYMVWWKKGGWTIPDLHPFWRIMNDFIRAN